MKTPRPAWYALASIPLMTPCIAIMSVNGVIPGVPAGWAEAMVLGMAAMAGASAYLATQVLDPNPNSSGNDAKILAAVCAFGAVLVTILEMHRETGESHGAMTSLLVLCGIGIAGAMIGALRMAGRDEPPEREVIAFARRLGGAGTAALAAIAVGAPGLLTAQVARIDPDSGALLGMFLSAALGLGGLVTIASAGAEGVMANVKDASPY